MLLMMTGIVLAVTTGLHFEVVKILISSFTLMPFGQFPGAAETGAWAANRAAFAFSASLALSLPFVALGFIYSLAIGAANRAMPQMMITFVGIPAITLTGLILLALSAPVVLETWQALLQATLITFQAQ